MRQFLLFVCLGCIMASGCVVAPDQFSLLENRITALENEGNRQAAVRRESAGKNTQINQELEGLRRNLEDTGKITRENYAEVKYELQEIKAKFHQMEALIEEIKHGFGARDQARGQEFEKRLEQLDKAISRNFEKVITLEKYMGFEPSVSGAAAAGGVAGAAAKAPVKDTEEAVYNRAKKMFDDGNKEGARIQFENFINTYPDSEKADNARFWIADSYYAEKWYEKAILEYQKVLETYPGSNKIAAARLKQGYAFAELGEKANARLILKELIKRHPDSKEAGYAAKKLKTLN